MKPRPPAKVTRRRGPCRVTETALGVSASVRSWGRDSARARARADNAVLRAELDDESAERRHQGKIGMYLALQGAPESDGGVGGHHQCSQAPCRWHSGLSLILGNGCPGRRQGLDDVAGETFGGSPRATSIAARSRANRARCSGQTQASNHRAASSSSTGIGCRSMPTRELTSTTRAAEAHHHCNRVPCG